MVSTTSIRTLLAANINDNTSNDITPEDLRDVFDATLDALDTAAGGGAIDFAKGQIAGEITAPANRTYILELSAPFAYEITALYVKTAAGTATCTIQINGASISELTDIAVSTTLGGGAAFSGNAVSISQPVTMILTDVAGASELSFALRYTRT